MQETKIRKTNLQRSETTRGLLLDAAHRLFVEQGYADTATPEIVAAAGLTRGALYHHFEDKKALFLAVAQREAGRVAAEIEAGVGAQWPPSAALAAGTAAYFDAMAKDGRTRLLLLDGPAVLGIAAMTRLDEAHGMRTLQEGLAAAIAPRILAPDKLVALASLLSAAFDRAVLCIAEGQSRQVFEELMGDMIQRAIAGPVSDGSRTPRR